MRVMTAEQQEAMRFIELYCKELNIHEEYLKQRIEAIEEGAFYLSTEELTYAAKVAWRNSNKCIGRLFWRSLQVFDRRTCTAEQTVFEALLTHIQFATNGGKVRPTISIFETNKVRIWNHQLIRFAGYETESGVIGDPHSIAFTKQVEKLGWRGQGTRFDVLPLVIQLEGKQPQFFEIPEAYICRVPIEHPSCEEVNALELQWYGVPFIADMPLQAAGVTFQAAPFNGWYMGTEIGARNLADVDRYDALPAVAKALQLDTSLNSYLWKDRALVELNIAVLHSFKKYGVSIVDHHTAAQQFSLFQQKEAEQEREVTGNWVWLVPPLSPATTTIYHRPINNTIKRPNYIYQPLPYIPEHK